MNRKLLLALPLLIGASVALTFQLNPLDAQPSAAPLAPPPDNQPASDQHPSPPNSAAAAAGPVSSASPAALPGSLAGTAVDGRFRLDSAGNLLISEDIRRIFDYFLSTLGEESLARSIQRLQAYIRSQLAQPAEGQALALLAQYLQYKEQLLSLERDLPQLASLDAMRQREQAVQALRAAIFSAEVHQVFFANEEAYNQFTLQRLSIRHDPSLSDTQKAAALDQLRSSLPEQLQELIVPQLQNELRTQTAALQAEGASPAQIQQLRLQLVGAEATARLEALDQRRQQWAQRLDQYRQEKARIESNHGLSQSDKAAAIASLAEERFAPQERLRLAAAEELAAARAQTP